MSSIALNVPKSQKQARSEAIGIIRHALEVVTQPGQTVELRIPGIQGKRTDSGYFNDLDKLAVAAADYESRAEGVYITLNPVQPALLARSANRVREYAKQTTADKDILLRRWIFIDFDPVRPAGISSSDEENQLAIERASACRERLAQRAIPAILANSGNGAHLLIPIDWPNDDASTTLIKDFLALIDARFSDERVKVDTGMIGASHLIKLYGTMARKGDSIAERPHRRSCLLDVPELLDPVSAETIRKLTAAATPMNSTPPQETERKDRDEDVDRTLIDAVKARFDLVAYAERVFGVQALKDKGEFRLPGNGGLLINPDKGTWYHHSGHEGGDAFDLVGRQLYGATWSRRNADMFVQVLHEAASFAGVALPPPKIKAKVSTNEAGTSEKHDGAAKLDLFDAAKAWQVKHGQDLAWDTDRGMWRRWIGTHWQIERTSETLDVQAAQMLREVGIPVSGGHKTDGLLKFARGLCKQQFKVTHPVVNFKNGTLEVLEKKLRDHQRTDLLTRCLPHEYSENGNYQRIQTFLGRTMPDPVARQAYMTHIGVALIGDTTLHKTVVLFGPTRSGKSTLLKLAQATLGYKPGQFPTSTLFSSEGRGANSRAAWIDSNPNLVCLDEFPQDALSGEGEELFKSMTAHGGVSMWLKYQDERAENTWTPKLMFATNNRLRYRDQSGALTRRLLIIECPNSIPDAKQDSDLLKKLDTELGAFAVACIRLAVQAQQQRKYPESDSMSNLLSDIETNGDSIKLWLLENCVFEEDAFETTAALYQDYRLWCDENGVNPASRPRMRDVICTYRPTITASRRRTVDPKTGEVKAIWGLVGVRLRTPFDDLPESDDPVEPETGSGDEGDNDAIRSSDPVDSSKLSETQEVADSTSESAIGKFSENDRITGSPLVETSPATPEYVPKVPDLLSDPALGTVCTQPTLLTPADMPPERVDLSRYFPDLAPNTQRSRSTRDRPK